MQNNQILKLSEIRIDGGTQARDKLDQDLVKKYADAMKEGDLFPRIVVFFDGSDYWLADGFHRYLALKSNGTLETDATVANGTQRDAKLHSFAANARHGMPMTKAEQRTIIETMLQDEEWGQWSLREIASHVGVSHMTVARVKEALEKKDEPPAPKPQKEQKVAESTKKEPAAKPVAPSTVTSVTDESALDEMAETINALSEENTMLKDKIAVGQWDATEIEKIDVQDLITELRERIRVLEIENAALRDSRDMFQNRNAELISQVKSLQAKLKKLGA